MRLGKKPSFAAAGGRAAKLISVRRTPPLPYRTKEIVREKVAGDVFAVRASIITV